jgi:release factor glutamine methyltransferase
MKNCIIDRLQKVGCIFAEEETQLLISQAGSIEDLMKIVEI